MQMNFEISSAKGTTKGNFQMNMAPFVPYQHNPVENVAPEPEQESEPEEQAPLLMTAPEPQVEPDPEPEVIPKEEAPEEEPVNE